MKTTAIIGIDEAGYGPNLGPLVISASVWPLSCVQIAEPEVFLKDSLVRCGIVSDSTRKKNGLIEVGDSKKMYKSGQSPNVLGKNVLPIMSLGDEHRWTWRQLFLQLDPKSEADLDELPWNRDYDYEIPSVDPNIIQSIRLLLEQEGLGIPFLKSRVINPGEFNESVEKFASKGTAHVNWVLELLRESIDALPQCTTKIHVYCDKLGARNTYTSFLCMIFDGVLIHAVVESKDMSEYRFEFKNRQINVRFLVRGESVLPIGFASMTSKYLRELAMQSFNAFWNARVPDLKPTAGYPLDAKRFLTEVEASLNQIRLNRSQFWRTR